MSPEAWRSADRPRLEHAPESAVREWAAWLVSVEVDDQVRRVEDPTVLAMNTSRCSRSEVCPDDANHKATLAA